MENKQIIFLGDSITECYKLNNYFKNRNLINKGKSGDTTVNIINRLAESVFTLKADTIILLIGTNDLELLNSSYLEVVKNIKIIIKKIKTFNKNIKIYLQSIYPVNEKIKPLSVGKRTNNNINLINDNIKKIKETTFLDVASCLKNKNELLNEKYTIDGLHLNEEGYRAVTIYLKSKIKELL